MRSYRWFFLFLLIALSGTPAHAGTGTEGASFLNTPVGAEPAALAGAYSAMATDAYAPAWNPGGLGQVDSSALAAQYISGLETLSDTHLGYVYPFKKGAAGVSFRYLGSGDIKQTDNLGNDAGKYTSHYGAYALAYGRPVTNKLSLGVTGKFIEAGLAGVSASAYAFDFGSLYQATDKLRIAGVVSNLGTTLTFIDQHDPLPLAFRLGGAYKARENLTLALEGVHRQSGLDSLHAGLEWSPADQIVLRVGYRTDTLKGLSPLAGLTTGIGFKFMGQTISYAWLPLGDLGNTQYISILMRFNGFGKDKAAAVNPSIKAAPLASKPQSIQPAAPAAPAPQQTAARAKRAGKKSATVSPSPKTRKAVSKGDRLRQAAYR